MYKCIKCNNTEHFEEVNVIKTYVNQKEDRTSDEFFYRENVICLECDSTMEDGDVIEE